MTADLYTFQRYARVTITGVGYSDTARVMELGEQDNHPVLFVAPDHGHLPVTREPLTVEVVDLPLLARAE